MRNCWKSSHKGSKDTKSNTKSTLYLCETSCLGVLVARKKLDEKLLTEPFYHRTISLRAPHHHITISPHQHLPHHRTIEPPYRLIHPFRIFFKQFVYLHQVSGSGSTFLEIRLIGLVYYFIFNVQEGFNLMF
jgi:hypothetical protein